MNAVLVCLVSALTISTATITLDLADYSVGCPANFYYDNHLFWLFFEHFLQFSSLAIQHHHFD